MKNYKTFFDQLQLRFDKLQSVKHDLGKRGFSDSTLPTDTQIRAMVLLGEHDRGAVPFGQVELKLFHVKGLLNNYQDVDNLSADMLRFLLAVLPWVRKAMGISDLLKGAELNTQHPDFPNGALVCPEVMELNSYALPSILKIELSNIEAVRVIYMNKVAEELALPKYCDLYVPIHAALQNDGSASHIVIVGADGANTFRRELPVVINDNILNTLFPNRWVL